MIADRIKMLREENGLTQADLAKILGITRSSVNAWEQGLNVPSTAYIVELSNYFGVSTDFILGRESNVSLDVAGLTEQDVQTVYHLIAHLKARNKENFN